MKSRKRQSSDEHYNEQKEGKRKPNEWTEEDQFWKEVLRVDNDKKKKKCPRGNKMQGKFRPYIE